MKPGVSVVIPLHRGASTVADTLHSLRAQTLPPLEVIVVDDRSDDGGPAVAAAALEGASFAARFLASDAGNAPRTRALGELAAAGDRLMFLDADDVLGPDALAGLAEALDADPGAGLALCRWLRLERDAGEDAWRSAPASCPPRRAGEPLLSAWLRGWYHPPCAALWARDAFRHTGGWDPLLTVLQDGDLVMRHLLRAGDAGVAFARRGVAYYRRPAGGAATVSGRRATGPGLASRLRVFEKVGHRLEESGRLATHREALMAALHAVRVDAEAAGEPDAAAGAGRLSRRFRAPLAGRLGRRLRPRPTPPAPAADPHGPAADHAAPGPFPAAVRGAAPEPERLDLPGVTAVIPVYNRPEAVARAIRSVLTETEVPLELLVVDDASTDGTTAAVEALAAADPRLRLLRQPENRGVAAARNRGMREARGPVIAFLDSDDHWLPGTLAPRLAALAAAGPGVALLCSGISRFDGERTIRREPEPGAAELPALYLENGAFGATINGLLRRHATATAGFFDEELEAIEDWEFCVRLAKQQRIGGVPLVTAHYDDAPAAGGDRRSRARAANLRAREQLFGRHGPAMLRAGRGVAAAFLLETARRHLARPEGDADPADPAAAGRLAWRAWRLNPASPKPLRLLRWARSAARSAARSGAAG